MIFACTNNSKLNTPVGLGRNRLWSGSPRVEKTERHLRTNLKIKQMTFKQTWHDMVISVACIKQCKGNAHTRPSGDAILEVDVWTVSKIKIDVTSFFLVRKLGESDHIQFPSLNITKPPIWYLRFWKDVQWPTHRLHHSIVLQIMIKSSIRRT